MRNQFIYEDNLNYIKPASLPIQNKIFYNKALNEYIDYYVKNKLQNKWAHLALGVWKRISGILDFSQKIDQGERDQYYKEVDKMTGYRESLIGINYSVLLDDDDTKKDQAARAASLVHSVLRFQSRLQNGQFEQDQLKGMPLEMGQYENLIGTHLVAKTKTDVLVKAENTGYIILLREGVFYKYVLPTPYSPEAVCTDFKKFLSAKSIERASGLAHLTGCRRGTVGKWMAILEKDVVNRESLAVINKSMFFVNFETMSPPQERGELHRMTYTGNLANRWFHTSLQIVVYENGQAASVQSNRNYIDGNVGLRFASELFLGAKNLKLQNEVTESSRSAITHLPFMVPTNAVENWKKEVNEFIRPTSDYFRLKDIGNGILRNSLANSDTLFMIALQMASKKQIGRFASIIQLVNMSLYRGMGLNHALVSTPAVREFIDLAQKGESSKETLIESLEKAVKSYKAAQNEARAGMPTIHILHYWMMKASPLQKSIAVFFMLMTGIPGCKADGITSHPKMYPGNRTVGRPGIYIPYLSMFGLHYLIHENDIDLMFMPGKGTNLDLKSFSEDIRESLMLLKNLVPKVQVADERASQRAPDFYAT